MLRACEQILLSDNFESDFGFDMELFDMLELDSSDDDDEEDDDDDVLESDDDGSSGGSF